MRSLTVWLAGVVLATASVALGQKWQEGWPLPMAGMLLPEPGEVPDAAGQGWKYPWDLLGMTKQEWRPAKSPRDALYEMDIELGAMSDQDFAAAWPMVKPLFKGLFPDLQGDPTRQQMADRLQAAVDGLQDCSVREFMRSQPNPAKPDYTPGLNGFSDTVTIISAIYTREFINKEKGNLDLSPAKRQEAAKSIQDEKLAFRKLRQEGAEKMVDDYGEEERVYQVYTRWLDEVKQKGDAEQIQKAEMDVKASRQRLDLMLKAMETAAAYSFDVACQPINGVDSGYLLWVSEDDGRDRTMTVKARVRVGRAMLDVSRVAEGPYAAKAVEETRALIEKLAIDLAPFAAR